MGFTNEEIAFDSSSHASGVFRPSDIVIELHFWGGISSESGFNHAGSIVDDYWLICNHVPHRRTRAAKKIDKNFKYLSKY